MNFLRLSALALLCLFFTACSDDDEDTEISTDAFLGTWSLTELEYKGSSSTSTPLGPVTTNYTGEGFDMDLTVEFSADPNTFTSEGDYGLKLNIETMGGSSTVEYPNLNLLGNGSWKRDNNKVTITQEGSVAEEATILELTDSTLTMSFDVSRLIPLGVNVDIDGTFSFTKQD